MFQINSESKISPNRKYSRFADGEREKLMLYLERGMLQKSIATILHRDKSTISREIARCKDNYSALSAMVDRKLKWGLSKNKVKLVSNLQLQKEVYTRIVKLGHSPQQVSNRLKKDYPNNNSMHIATETIYQFVYIHAKGTLKKEMLASLRRPRKSRQSRSKKTIIKGQIPDMQLITERPEEVKDRLIPGHWEGDLIVGKNHRSAIGTLVERSLRYTLIVPLKNMSSSHVALSFANAFKSIPTDIKKTLTYDQGREMHMHKDFTHISNLKVYFAHPHSPWEKGTVENTNGLIRQYFPKGTDFNKVTEKELQRVQNLLNTRPRKVLEWCTPEEALINFQLR